MIFQLLLKVTKIEILLWSQLSVQLNILITEKSLYDKQNSISNHFFTTTLNNIFLLLNWTALIYMIFFLLLVLMIYTQVVLITQPIWSRFLGIFMFLNESRSRRKTFIVTEYLFVHQEKYSHLVLLHVNVATCIALIVTLATSLMILVSFIHICGMFSIAR